MRNITEIILHCSATPEGKDFRAADIDRWHRAKGWKCIGYNYVIDLDGTIEGGRSLEMTGAHTIGHNANSIGICYIGGIDGKSVPKDTRTVPQKESMFALVRQLLLAFNLTLKDVHCHNEFANKACPSFSIEQFRKEYEDWLYAFYRLKEESK